MAYGTYTVKQMARGWAIIDPKGKDMHRTYRTEADAQRAADRLNGVR